MGNYGTMKISQNKKQMTSYFFVVLDVQKDVLMSRDFIAN
jgi:hypothetical protein